MEGIVNAPIGSVLISGIAVLVTSPLALNLGRAVVPARHLEGGLAV